MKTRTLFVITLLAISCFFGCSKDKAEQAQKESIDGVLLTEITDDDVQSEAIEVKYTYVEKGYDFTKDFVIEAENFFSPDFTPYPQYKVKGEETNSEDKNAKTNAKSTKTGTKTAEDDGTIPAGTVISVKPGLRKTGEYVTEYNTTMPLVDDSSTATSEAQVAQSEDTQNTEPFTVLAWGPNTRLSSTNKHPEFYIMFSEPVVPLAKLGTKLKTSDIFTITPPLKGEYRWNGTSLLTFIPKDEIDPQTKYTINVNSNAKSLKGKTIEGETKFVTTSDKLKVDWSTLGRTYKRENSVYFYKGEVPPEAANEYEVQFNYKVDPQNIKERSSLVVSSYNSTFNNYYKQFNNKLTFKTTQSEDDKYTVIYQIIEELKPESTIELWIDGEKADSFSTIPEFSRTGDVYQRNLGNGKFDIQVYFNCNVDPTTVLSGFKTDLSAHKLVQEDFVVEKNKVTIKNLPITYGSTFRLTITKKLKDTYGRPYRSDEYYDVTINNAQSFVANKNSGMKILESQFEKKTAFRYQNLFKNSKYFIGETKDPFNTKTRFYEEEVDGELTEDNLDDFLEYFLSASQGGDFSFDRSDLDKKHEDTDFLLKPIESELPSEIITLDISKRNEEVIEYVDFGKYLHNGKGAVRLDIASKEDSRYYTYLSPSFSTSTIQVTDLGVTTRVGINKTVALVTSLATGMPISGADVYVYCPAFQKYADIEQSENHFGKATTDENGIAIINYSLETINDLLVTSINQNNGNEPRIAIAVKTADDAVTFYPDTHSPYESGIYNSRSTFYPIYTQMRTFMFTDRGLYKPGETVSFKGLTRTQSFGNLKPVVSNYTIAIVENTWYKPKTIATLTGTTSENGSFDGKVTLPKDLTPGSYAIKYKIQDNTGYEHSKTINFRVAYFERLKFEASVAINDQIYTQGDTITATASASYLAGGALNGATYNNYWYSEPTYFTTDKPEFNKFSFGPENVAVSRNYLNNDKGNLSANGKAVFTCDTSSSSIKGMPYKYLVSSDITDASNQMISAGSETIVHPALYYIGIKGASGFSTFIKKGDDVTFDYKLALNDGTVAKNLAEITNANEKLTVELLLNDWTVVQQQGVGGRVYSRYEKVQTSEYKGEFPLSLSGRLKLTPKEVGYYTIRLSSKDQKGRDVISEKTFFVTGQTKSWIIDDSSTNLKLTPNKSMYVPGENATLLLESPIPEGHYLITVEREGIFTEEVRYFDSSINTIDIPIARNYVPTVYVSISSFQNRTGEPNGDYNEVDLNKPKSLYGICQLFIDKNVKSFDIEVQNAKTVYKPGEEATITLKASKNGLPLKNTELTLMAVDRSVLDLINYHVADPVEFFYDEYNFPLSVRGGDDRDYLMDPIIFETKNLSGGDATSEDKDEQERSDFTPTAVFEPKLITDENGEVTCTFKLPDSLTTYRITVFGVNSELLAIQEDSFIVQNPINVQQVMPRRLRERDTSECGVIITNLDTEPQEVTIKVSVQGLQEYLNSQKPVNSQNTANSPISTKNVNPEQVGKAFIDGDDTHVITVYPETTVPVYFDIAAEQEGTVNVQFQIRSNILNEKLVCPLIIEKPRVYETVTTTGIIGTDEKTIEEAVIIPGNSVDDEWYLDLSIGLNNDLSILPALKYFAEYPYNCFEQRSSRLIAFLLYEDLLNKQNPEFMSEIGNVHDYVVENFKIFDEGKTKQGFYPYWGTGSLTANYLVTTRIAHAAALALSNGYTEKELLINKTSLINNLLAIFKDANKTTSYSVKNYALYVASLLDKNSVTEANLKTAINNSKTLTDFAIAGLISVELNKSESAKLCYSKIEPFIQPSSRSLNLVQNNDSYWLDYSTLNSEQSTLSFVANFFAKYDSSNPYQSRFIFALNEKQRNGYWSNTFNTATALLATKNLLTFDLDENSSISTNCTLGGTTLISKNLNANTEQTYKNQFASNLEMFKGVPTNIPLPLVLTKNGKANLFYTVQMQYSLPQEITPAKEMGLTVTTRIIDTTTGEEIEYKDQGSSVMQLENGKIYKMIVTLSSTKAREYVALNMSIPSGAEILDTNFVTTKTVFEPTVPEDDYWAAENYYKDYGYYDYGHYVTNQEIYDNQVQYFYDSFEAGSTTATFNFRATRTGVYPTPPAYAECMYQPEVFGRSSGTLFTID